MNLKNMVNKLEGWNTIDDVREKLGVKRSTVYLYMHELNKAGFVIQKVRKPRGTMYLISKVPKSAKYYGMHEGTELVVSNMEFSHREVTNEQRVAYFLSRFVLEKNRRYYEECKRIVRRIKDWKLLYRYVKAYDVKEEFKDLYTEMRRKMRVPRMPVRYRKLLGVENAS